MKPWSLKFSLNLFRKTSLLYVIRENSNVKFNYFDALALNDQLTEEERSLKDHARIYCQKKLLPRVTNSFRNEEFDPNVIPEMGEMGFLGAPYHGYGCAGISNVGYGLIAREIEAIDSGYRSTMSVQTSLVIGPIHSYGTEEQKQKYIPDLASGKKIGAFGLTEPDHGSDPGGIETKAIWDENKKIYRLNGTKTWISNSPVARIFIVWARSDRHNNDIKGFILERGFTGLSTPKINGKVSLRVSVTGQIAMDNVPVPEENILPNCNGLTGPFGCLNNARLGIAFGALGAAEACFYGARDYSLNRFFF